MTRQAIDKYVVIMTRRLTSWPASDADELYAVIREVRRLFHRLANATHLLHQDLGVSTAQRAILEELADTGDRSVPDLARRKGVSRQHVQVVANELESAGLVEGVPNPAHQRSPLLRPTQAGQRTFDEMRSRENRLLEAVVMKLTSPHLPRVAHTLREIGDAVESCVDASLGPEKGGRSTRSRRRSVPSASGR